MKSRPILFQGAMVRPLPVGNKTQTRRVFKLPKGHRWDELQGGMEKGSIEADQWPGWWNVAEFRCPYGDPGDQLWVREAWRAGCLDDHHAPSQIWANSFGIHYEADGEPNPLLGMGKYRPGMFMPRWASRITLEITGVRVERLQDISDEDAIAEGIERDAQPGDSAPLWRNYKTGGTTICPTHSYETLWESINGPGSWAANPWVWVVEFKVVKS